MQKGREGQSRQSGCSTQQMQAPRRNMVLQVVNKVGLAPLNSEVEEMLTCLIVVTKYLLTAADALSSDIFIYLLETNKKTPEFSAPQDDFLEQQDLLQ